MAAALKISGDVPKLRFSGFSNKWEERRLKDIFENSKDKGDESLPIFSVTINHGLVSRDSLERKIENLSIPKNNLRVHKNFLVYNMMRMWQGAVGIADRECMVSPAYVVLKPKENTHPPFFINYFERARSLYLFKSYSYGLTSDRLRLYYKDFGQIKFFLPPLPEQQKIADFLSTVDDWIKNLKREKEQLEKYKKGMMQQIFSQKIRFKADDGKDFPEWEEKQLGECLEYEQPTQYIVKNTEYSDSFITPVLTAGKSFILGYTNEKDGIFKHNLPVIIFDDFTTASKFVNFPFKVKSSAMKILKSKSNVDIKFVFEVMKQIKFEIGGHGRHWISIFSKINIPFPTLPEQQKIADFLSSIDTLIEDRAKQIKKAEKWKKGLMQQLFI